VILELENLIDKGHEKEQRRMNKPRSYIGDIANDHKHCESNKERIKRERETERSE
jgi:hypothetical protein